MAFKESLREFIRDNLIDASGPTKLADDAHLVKCGIIDSASVLQIMAFIEDEIGTRVPDSEIRIDNFESVARIDAMVQRLVAESRNHPG